MQTTLRIDDRLYREAKAEAARAGLTLTRFLEEGLRMRLEKKPPSARPDAEFRIYDAKVPVTRSWEEIRRIADEEQNRHDVGKLGMTLPQP